MGHQRLMDELTDTDDASRIVRVVNLPNPAAGADLTFTVPGDQIWRPISLRALLTTAIAVANRAVRLTVAIGGEEITRIPAAAVQAGSLAVVYTAARTGHSTSLVADGATAVIGIPELVLMGGTTISTSTANLQAADQWSGVRIAVETAYTFQLRKQGALAGRRQSEFLATQLEGT